MSADFGLCRPKSSAQEIPQRLQEVPRICAGHGVAGDREFGDRRNSSDHDPELPAVHRKRPQKWLAAMASKVLHSRNSKVGFESPMESAGQSKHLRWSVHAVIIGGAEHLSKAEN